jgi:hypothetical protein
VKHLFLIAAALALHIISMAQTKHKYVMQGRAYYDGTSQIYKLDITDDGSGNFSGENVSILPTGERLIGPVKGRIDYAKKMIYFQELKIKNLPAGKSQDDYLFFTITATFTTSGNKTMIVGTFTSKGLRGNKGSGGTIKLVGSENVEEIRKQYVQAIEKKKVAPLKPATPKPKPVAPKPLVAKPKLAAPKPVIKASAPAAKPPVAAVKKLEPKPIVVKPVEVIEVAADVPEPAKDTVPPRPTVQISSEPIPAKKLKVIDYSADQLVMEIVDYDQLDGDMVTITFNDKVIVDSLVLTGQKFSLNLDIANIGNGTGVDTLKIIANNEGYFYPNSASILLRDGATMHRYNAENEKGSKCYVVLRRKRG